MSKAEPRPIYTDHDKRRTLDGLASLVSDGAVAAVGGGLSSREPMALLRAILRRGTRGLTVVGSAHGIDIDLLCGGSNLAIVGKLRRLRARLRHGPELQAGARIRRGQN